MLSGDFVAELEAEEKRLEEAYYEYTNVRQEMIERNGLWLRVTLLLPQAYRRYKKLKEHQNVKDMAQRLKDSQAAKTSVIDIL